jgi:nucleoid-associated protein YgaU
MDPTVIVGLLDSADASWVTARAGSAGVDDLVGLVASVIAGAVLGWVGLLWVLTAAARIPGLAGRAAAGTAVRLAPSVVTGLVRAGVGLTVVSTPAMVTPPASAAGVPVAAHDAEGSEDRATAALPGVGRPGDAPVRAEVMGAANAGEPDAPPDGRSGRATTPDAVVVVAGDCLWTIAARAIGPDATDAEIAATWPRWYARNRGVVGGDPDLLIPGTVLRPPV